MITPVTRRDLRELLGSRWRGRLTDAEFLLRLYDLDALPSTDHRFETMTEDIVQHTEANDDWDSDWIFDDLRLRLDDDETLLRLVAETLHPEVVNSRSDVERVVTEINSLLLPDGFELFPASSMSGRSVFSWRRTVPRQPPVGEFPSSLIAGLSQILPGLTTSTGIDSMFEAEDFPTPSGPSNNKEEKVKSWLRTAQADESFDHWAGLGRVLAPIMDVDEGALRTDTQARLGEVLAKRGITYLTGGLFTTAQQTTIAALPTTPQLPQEAWTEIGSGGFGVVYRARDPRLEIDFALKVFEPYPGLTSHAEARARFVREAGLLFRLRHESIVRVFDAGELSDGRPYIKMEYFDGLNLQKSRDQRAFSSAEAIMIVGKLAAAVEHAHSRAIIHRDIKPSNILLSHSAEEVRLIDFGLGIIVEEAVARARLTTTAHQFGDAFSAPELLENAKTTDPAVDVYAIGAVWFWLHAGRSPKGATGIEDTIKEFDIDDALRGLLHSCLLPSAKRPTSARVVEELRAAFRKQRAASQKDSTSAESPTNVRRAEQYAKELERRVHELESERLEREREIRIVLKQQGPATRSGGWIMTNCHIENHGESHFIVEEHHCEARLNASYWRYMKMDPTNATLSFPSVLKTNQVVKPGDIGQLSLKITVEAVRDALTTAGLPNPSEWLWTFMDTWIVVRCQARGVSREERKPMR